MRQQDEHGDEGGQNGRNHAEDIGGIHHRGEEYQAEKINPVQIMKAVQGIGEIGPAHESGDNR